MILNIDWHDLISAIGLLLVIEGLPFLLAPHLAREAFYDLLRQDQLTLRILGMCLIILGLLTLYLLR